MSGNQGHHALNLAGAFEAVAATAVAAPSSSLMELQQKQSPTRDLQGACKGVHGGDQEMTCCTSRTRIAAHPGTGLS